MNIRDSIKNIKSAFRKKETPPVVPLDQGSLYTDIQKLETAEELVHIDQINASYPSNFDRTINYNEFLILNFHADYFTNYFKLKCDNKELLEIVLKVFRGYFYFGNVGIYFLNNKMIPVYEVNRKLKADNSVESVEVAYLSNLFNNDINTNIFKKPDNTFKIKNEMLKDYISLNGGLSAYIKWLPFCKLQKQVLTMVNDHRYFVHKNLGINCKDPTNLKKEIEIYYNLEVPFFINIGSTTNTTTNNFVDLNQTDKVNNKVFEYYESITKIYYELLGRRKNTDFKKERNITAEIAASQSNFDILLNNEKLLKKIFLKELSKKTGINIEIEEEGLNEINGMNNQQPTAIQSDKE